MTLTFLRWENGHATFRLNGIEGTIAAPAEGKPGIPTELPYARHDEFINSFNEWRATIFREGRHILRDVVHYEMTFKLN